MGSPSWGMIISQWIAGGTSRNAWAWFPAVYHYTYRFVHWLYCLWKHCSFWSMHVRNKIVIWGGRNFSNFWTWFFWKLSIWSHENRPNYQTLREKPFFDGRFWVHPKIALILHFEKNRCVKTKPRKLKWWGLDGAHHFSHLQHSSGTMAPWWNQSSYSPHRRWTAPRIRRDMTRIIQ